MNKHKFCLSDGKESGRNLNILNNVTHPLRYDFDSRQSCSSGRLLLPAKTNTTRYKSSFLPSDMTAFNENCDRV